MLEKYMTRLGEYPNQQRHFTINISSVKVAMSKSMKYKAR